MSRDAINIHKEKWRRTNNWSRQLKGSPFCTICGRLHTATPTEPGDDIHPTIAAFLMFHEPRSSAHIFFSYICKCFSLASTRKTLIIPHHYRRSNPCLNTSNNRVPTRKSQPTVLICDDEYSYILLGVVALLGANARWRASTRAVWMSLEMLIMLSR